MGTCREDLRNAGGAQAGLYTTKGRAQARPSCTDDHYVVRLHQVSIPDDPLSEKTLLGIGFWIIAS